MREKEKLEFIKECIGEDAPIWAHELFAIALELSEEKTPVKRKEREMAWLSLKPMKEFLIGKTIKEVNTDKWPEAVLVFTDNTAVKLKPCIDIKDSLVFTGGSISISPYVIATPLKLENGESKIIQLKID